MSQIREPDRVLQDLVRCTACSDFLWFSREGYLTCRCDGFPYRDLSPDVVLEKILEEVLGNLENPEFLGPVTAATNASLAADGMRFAEPEVLKIMRNSLENAVAGGRGETIRRTLATFVDEVRIAPDGNLEIYLVAVKDME